MAAITPTTIRTYRSKKKKKKRDQQPNEYQTTIFKSKLTIISTFGAAVAEETDGALAADVALLAASLSDDIVDADDVGCGAVEVSVAGNVIRTVMSVAVVVGVVVAVLLIVVATVVVVVGMTLVIVNRCD